MNGLSPKEVVLAFFEQVRSGKNVQAAHELLAETHLAHQVVSGCEYAITRTPADYADHIAEMRAAYGDFRLTWKSCCSKGTRFTCAGSSKACIPANFWASRLPIDSLASEPAPFTAWLRAKSLSIGFRSKQMACGGS